MNIFTLKSRVSLVAVSFAWLLLAGCGTWGTAKNLPEAKVAQAEVSSNYRPYDAAAVKLAVSEGKKTAVFFHGATCGSCAKLDADIKANVANIPSDMVVFNADWDKNQALAKEYGVPKYHTVSYVSDKGLDKNVTGLFTLNDLVAAF